MTTQEFEVPLPPTASRIDEKLVREIEAFHSRFQELWKQYPEEFVAIHDGNVVSHGADQIVVAKAAYEEFGYIPILIRRVTKAPPRIVRIPTFRRLNPVV